jgi:hypothetical protein
MYFDGPNVTVDNEILHVANLNISRLDVIASYLSRQNSIRLTLRWLGILMIATFGNRWDLALEDPALREQLGVLKRKGVPRLQPKDRMFWIILSHLVQLAKAPAFDQSRHPGRLATARLQNVLG